MKNIGSTDAVAWAVIHEASGEMIDVVLIKPDAHEGVQYAPLFFARPEGTVTHPFHAVGYVNKMGGVEWEPNKGPIDLNPGQLIYVSHLPSRSPQEREGR